MEREMAGLSLLLLLGFQGLMYLTTVWSVRVRTWYSCRQVKAIKEATHILVIPYKHQGSGELLDLIKTKEGAYFNFQKKKYIWDADLGEFRGLEFPGDKPTTFMELKGYTGIKGETEMRKVRGKYGYNR
jgi:cation-transporting ATPase 13A1